MGSRGISNFQIEDAIANIGDDDLINNFVIPNTDSSKGGTH